MYTVIAILIVIASVILTLVVLVQNSKGGGLAANFAAGNQTFGVRQTADFLEKATWTLAIIIIVLCRLLFSNPFAILNVYINIHIKIAYNGFYSF